MNKLRLELYPYLYCIINIDNYHYINLEKTAKIDKYSIN